MGVLGKVTGDLEAARGPDVTMEIVVPPKWAGRRVSVGLPRNLHCARCEGGGCDLCQRAGAISLRGRKDRPTELSVQLPEEVSEAAPICLRIPEQGGQSDGDLGRGHLFLTVRGGPDPSPVVSLLESGGIDPDRKELMKRSLVMAAVLILLFLGMLKLSGWL